MFSKILIANRGEIAVRIIRACREMGISTVAIYSEADKDSLHVQLADESYCVGGNRVADSYLNMPAILTVAVESGAQAIHPGYGLLSENAKFVSLCEQCNINFIGPSSEMIKLLGDKDNARKTMRAAGVPVTPGCDIVESVEQAKEEAEKIGFPLLIKARSGGGGKGIRRVDSIEQFEEAFLSASSEAQSAFGDGACYIEKFIHPVKHIEMQLLCDKYGNIVCLGERECSVQRKNQKMIEESPSPALDEKTRKEMMIAAVKAAKAVNYVNAGTVEFLLDMDNNFYFMEMNTRLQVEHGVTEMVTGLDIVQWQIRIAAGAEISLVAVSGVSNAYYIKYGEKYLTVGAAGKNQLVLADSAGDNYWTFTDDTDGVKATAKAFASIMMTSTGAASKYIRSYVTTNTSGVAGVVFFLAK